MMSATTEGMGQIHLSLKVPMSEMKDWEPERIASYMEGLAKIVAAVNPSNWPDKTEPAALLKESSKETATPL